MSTMCILVSYVGCNKSPKTYKQQNLLNNRNLFSCLSGGHVCMLSHFSHGQMFVTTWAVARQAPLSMGFSRQEYWSGLPCPPPGESSRPRDQTHISYVSYWQVSPLPLTLPGRAEVQNQRVGGSVLPLKPLGNVLALLFGSFSGLQESLGCSCPSPVSVSVYTWPFPLHLCCLLSCLL